MKKKGEKSFVLGIACNGNKWKQFFEPFCQFLIDNHGIDCIHVDDPNFEKLKIDIMLHKLTDDLNNLNELKESKIRCQRMKEYISKHEHVIVIDDLKNVEKLLLRNSLYKYLEESFSEIQNLKSNLSVPPFAAISIAELRRMEPKHLKLYMEKYELRFPLIIKSNIACGKKISHQMHILFNEDQVLSLSSTYFEQNEMIILQQYINHQSILYKIYVIGETVFVQRRISTKNFEMIAKNDIIYFDSQKQLNDELMDPTVKNDDDFTYPNRKFLDSIAEIGIDFNMISILLKNIMKLGLFGFDLIVERESGIPYIIDVNYLPNYSNVPKLYHHLLSYIQNQYENHILKKLIK